MSLLEESGLTDEALLDIWHRCGGYYKCPVDGDGKPLGRLAGYAGTYTQGDKPLHYVGLEYYNFGAIEEDYRALDRFAKALAEKIDYDLKKRLDWVLGVPLGGLTLAQRLAAHLDCRYIFAEKKVTKAATSASREESELVFGRHEPKPGTVGIAVEDVFNNFSTTGKTFDLVHSAGAVLIGLAGALNRSEHAFFGKTSAPGSVGFPVISLLHIPTPQYRQDDPLVVEAVQQGRVIWKPKDGWDELMQDMEEYKT